ncbi:GntR family transcriptional regulator [Desulfopila sp. IMCC35008]|uniref:GntR family transcriptional regulator n=1 Tax=Desulfopila sp. IMCC35008 TaxID=2653858 RepID=UPI0013D4E4F2|nr:GntR family transcriptional regulator [Desulfopila sp. IMCC35008]
MKQLRRSKSLTEMAVEGLREAIVTGQFRLGEPLSEIQLAASIGTSKTPVREALKQLRIEGLVTVVPQSGTFVFTLSAMEVIKMCELRLILEMAAFKLAYHHNREEFTKALQTVVDKMATAQQAEDIPNYLRLDTEFHEQLFKHCDNQFITDAYSLIGGKIAALRTHLSSLPQHTQLSFQEHREFVDAIDQKNLETATIVLEKHIGRSKETYAENIEDISMANRNSFRKAKR